MMIASSPIRTAVCTPYSRCLPVLGFVFCTWLGTSPTWGAKVSWRDHFVFQDSVKTVAGFDGFAVEPWSGRKKRKVWQAIRTARLLAPGVVQRATAYRPIQLYRSRDPHIDGARAIASPIRNGLYVTDRLLDTRKSKRVEDTLIHEWAHLIDTAHFLEIDPQWTAAVLPRMNRVRQAVRERGSKYFDRSFQQFSPDYVLTQDRKYRQLALNEGMPALYACTNLAESLAVFAERRVKGFNPPAEIDTFLRRHYFDTPFQPDPGMQRVHAAMALHVDGQRDAAILAYTELIESSTQYRTLLRFRAAALRAERRWDEAILDLTQALDVFRASPEATADIHKQRARCYLLSRRYDDAIADVTRALEISGPGRSDNYVARADVWQRMGKTDEAIADLTHAIRIHPELRRAYQQRAYLWRRQGQPEREEADWTKLMELAPDDLNALRQRASLRKRQQRTEEAIADWTALLARKSNDQSALTARAKTYESAGKFQQAEHDYQQLTIINPNAKFRYGMDRARCLIALGAYRAALQEMDEAMQQRENYYLPYQEKAWLLATCSEMAIRDGVEARRLAKKACELTKQRQFRCLESLAAAFAELGEFPQAVEWQSKALDLARTEQDRLTARERVALYESGRTVYAAK